MNTAELSTHAGTGDETMTGSLLDLTDQEITSVSRLFGLLGDPTRVRILLLLCKGELNVTRLCATLGLPQPTVSHHLGLLRRGGLLQTRREGKAIHYGLDGKLEYAEGCELNIRSTAGVRVRIIK
jgi:ArsR family transcriptional regulator, zinc-responsive transcriptional repressor